MHLHGWGRLTIYKETPTPTAVVAVDAWADNNHGPGLFTTGSPISLAADTHYRVLVEFRPRSNGSAALELHWNPGVTVWTATFGAYQFPRYGLATQSITENDGQSSSTTKTAYADPAVGVPTGSTEDSGGTALTTTTDYEAMTPTPPPDHFRRVSKKTLPAGNATTYQYYGADGQPTSVVDPCGSGSVNQRGRVRSTTGPAPGGTGTPRVEESVYDVFGRTRATRLASDPSWTCLTYDSRGRVTQRSIPAISGAPARVVNRKLPRKQRDRLNFLRRGGALRPSDIPWTRGVFPGVFGNRSNGVIEAICRDASGRKGW